MKPPIPTKPTEPNKEDSKLATLLPVGLALVGVIAIAAALYWQNTSNQRPLPPTQSSDRPFVRRDDGAYDGDGRQRGEMPRFMGRRTTEELTRVSPSDEPLTGEPAGLPVYPSTDGEAPPERQTGLRRVEGLYREEVSTWLVPSATPDQVRQFYWDAAGSAGFTPLERPGGPTTAPGSHPTHRMSSYFIRASRNGDASVYPSPDHDAMNSEILMIRLMPDEDTGGVRVLLWFRYPMSNSR